MVQAVQFEDGAIISAAELERIAARWQGRETGGFRQEVRFFDFESNGKPFTQVAIVLTPDRPLFVNGRKVVMVASEGGHDSGREFVEDDLHREGPGIWLARRGVTFIALTRLGRWNFLADEALGSWRSVPLDRRMPVFHRAQAGHWEAADFTTEGAAGVSSPTGSQACRFPRPGSALEAHMMALTPTTSMTGFERALDGLGILADRANLLLLYWGFSTGGAFLWPFAKKVAPDGIAGFGMATFPVAYYASRGFRGDHRWLYDSSAFRVRERGLSDYAFFSPDLTDEERLPRFQEALRSARFKSFEDTFMFFNVAALTESVTRLWNAPFLPAEIRARGFAALLRENLDLAFPDSSLAPVRVLELSGTRDEILPDEIVRVSAEVVRPYCDRYTAQQLEGLHHSIDAGQTPLFASVWLEAIVSGYFG